MKKMILVLALVVLPVATTMAFHPNTQCDRCHIAHRAMDNSGIPLWNGETGIAAGTAFTNYDSPTLDAEIGDPSGATLLCLGCHDGDAHYAINDSTGDMSATHPIGFTYDTALTIKDTELVDPSAAGSSTVVGGEGTIAADMLVDGILNCISCHEIHANGLHGITMSVGGADVDFDMPHLVNIPGITYKAGYGSDRSDPESYSIAYGALCTTCHIK